jgi:hypothetical protein
MRVLNKLSIFQLPLSIPRGQHFFYRGLYGVPAIYLISNRLFFDNKADPGVRREKAKKEPFSS